MSKSRSLTRCVIGLFLKGFILDWWHCLALPGPGQFVELLESPGLCFSMLWCLEARASQEATEERPLRRKEVLERTAQGNAM